MDEQHQIVKFVTNYDNDIKQMFYLGYNYFCDRVRRVIYGVTHDDDDDD